jgi:hypothetical protein
MGAGLRKVVLFQFHKSCWMVHFVYRIYRIQSVALIVLANKTWPDYSPPLAEKIDCLSRRNVLQERTNDHWE